MNEPLISKLKEIKEKVRYYSSDPWDYFWDYRIIPLDVLNDILDKILSDCVILPLPKDKWIEKREI